MPWSSDRAGTFVSAIEPAHSRTPGQIGNNGTPALFKPVARHVEKVDRGVEDLIWLTARGEETADGRCTTCLIDHVAEYGQAIVGGINTVGPFRWVPQDSVEGESGVGC